MIMSSKFCMHCGTPLEEDALFCVGCGQKTDAATGSAQTGESEQAQNAPPQHIPYEAPAFTAAVPGPTTPAPQQTAAYYQQPPMAEPQQTNVYYQQPQQPPAGQGYPPQPPAGGYAYTPYPGAANAGNTRQKTGNRGLLIGGIIGLVVLAIAIVVVVLVFAKPPAAKPGSSTAGPTVSSGGDVIQGNNEKPPVADNIVKDALLADIAGIWEGEIEFTRIEGFEKLPAEDLPPDFKEIINEVLANPAPLEFEIEADGNWDFYADVVMGMWFSSDDYDYDKYESSPLLITGLKNGAFDVSYEEKIDEDDIQGNASMRLTGTVYENSKGLYIEGTISVSMKADGATIIEEGNYSVTRTSEAEADPTDFYTVPDASAEPDVSQPAGTDFSTSTRPELSDFYWYMDDVYYEGLPYDSTPITEFSKLTGGWKALFYYDPDFTMDAYGFDYLNVTIGGSVDSVQLTVDWYKTNFGGYEEYDISDEEDSVLYGAFEQGGMYLSGDGFGIWITEFYYLNGRQYAVGYMELQSGEPTYVALVRP